MGRTLAGAIAALVLCVLAGRLWAMSARAVDSAETPHASAGRAVDIAVLGDSLALGSGAGDTSGGFAFRIYRAIAANRPGSEITNMAIGGSTAADVARLQVVRLHEQRFDVVLLCVGGNDIVRGIPTAVFARDYRKLVSEIRAAAPQAPLVIVGVPDVSISPLFADHAPAIHRLSLDDDRAARDIAAAAGARYVDLFALTARMRDAAGFLSHDRFHPSDDGHAQIAAAVLPAVRRALAFPVREAAARRPAAR